MGFVEFLAFIGGVALPVIYNNLRVWFWYALAGIGALDFVLFLLTGFVTWNAELAFGATFAMSLLGGASYFGSIGVARWLQTRQAGGLIGRVALLIGGVIVIVPIFLSLLPMLAAPMVAIVGLGMIFGISPGSIFKRLIK